MKKWQVKVKFVGEKRIICSYGKVVKEFNRKIDRLQTSESKLYLPDKIEYAEVKENITTRSELNRLINSLKRFKRQGSEDVYETLSGEKITKWERRELRDTK